MRSIASSTRLTKLNLSNMRLGECYFHTPALQMMLHVNTSIIALDISANRVPLSLILELLCYHLPALKRFECNRVFHREQTIYLNLDTCLGVSSLEYLDLGKIIVSSYNRGLIMNISLVNLFCFSDERMFENHQLNDRILQYLSTCFDRGPLTLHNSQDEFAKLLRFIEKIKNPELKEIEETNVPFDYHEIPSFQVKCAPFVRIKSCLSFQDSLFPFSESIFFRSIIDSTIHTLSLNKCVISNENINHVVAFLNNNESVTRLSLENSHLSEEASTSIALMLGRNSSVIYLNLKDTNFHINAQPTYSQNIVINCTIQELVLSKEFQIVCYGGVRFNCSIQRLYGVHPDVKLALSSMNTSLERIEFLNGDKVERSGEGGRMYVETVENFETFINRGIFNIIRGEGTTATFTRDDMDIEWLRKRDQKYRHPHCKFEFIFLYFIIVLIFTSYYCGFFFSVNHAVHVTNVLQQIKCMLFVSDVLILYVYF